MSDQVWTYLGLGASALIGVLARFGKWWREDGKFDKQKALTELMSAPAIGMIGGGACRLYDPNMDPMIVGMACVTLGVLGIATVEFLLMKFLTKKIEG